MILFLLNHQILDFLQTATQLPGANIEIPNQL